MITINYADMHSQEGMERAVRDYLARVKTDGDGTFNGLLAAELYSCDFERRRLTLTVHTDHWMENPYALVHGGVSAAMLDMTMGLLCRCFSGGGMTPTVSMTVNYLHPVPVGAAVHISGELTMRGYTLCHAAGRIWTEEQGRDKPLCTATGSYIIEQKRK